MPVRIAELILREDPTVDHLRVITILGGIRLEGPLPHGPSNTFDLSAMLRCLREVRDICQTQTIEILQLRSRDFDPLDSATLVQVAQQIMPRVRIQLTP